MTGMDYLFHGIIFIGNGNKERVTIAFGQRCEHLFYMIGDDGAQWFDIISFKAHYQLFCPFPMGKYRQYGPLVSLMKTDRIRMQLRGKAQRTLMIPYSRILQLYELLSALFTNTTMKDTNSVTEWTDTIRGVHVKNTSTLPYLLHRSGAVCVQ